MKVKVSGEPVVPRGFAFSAGQAGIKLSGAPDLALVAVEGSASAAAMFTTNRVAAAPVQVGRAHLAASPRVRAVIVNSGNANCATGRDGIRNAKAVCAAAARALSVQSDEVFPSSTGVIGVPLPVKRITTAIPQLVADLATTPEAAGRFARGIMTTDTRPKIAAARIPGTKQGSSILGVAKGAGMIHPRLATMLVYLFTDVAARPAEVRSALKKAVATSFHRISVDGDTSTNDTVLLLASGGCGERISPAFVTALTAVCEALARQIVADAEGVQHVVELRVEGARNERDAEQVARAIAHSPLVKTAWAGADPNWGRVLAAAGYSGAAINPERVDIDFGPHPVCRKGQVAPFNAALVHEYLKKPEICVRVRLNQGRTAVTFWTCDLTTEYVHINADYHT